MFLNPEKPETITIMSFLISFGILITATLCLIAWGGDGPLLLIGLSGLMGTGALIALEWLRPNSLLPLYHIWNRMAAAYARLLHKWVRMISFHLIVSAVGLFGKQDPFRKQYHGKSNWQVKTSAENHTYRSQWNGENGPFKPGFNWILSFVGWTAVKKNMWMVLLLPHLLLLRISSGKQEEKSQSDIYTLY